MLSSRFVGSPASVAICASILTYLIAIFFVRHISWRDPGSLFFDPSKAYDRAYSDVRVQEAENFLSSAASEPFLRNSTIGTEQTHLCVGIATVARENARYLRTTVASLLEGLTQKERDAIHLVVFIANTEPSVHPAFNEAWLSNLGDELLLYKLQLKQMEHFRNLEEDHKVVSEKMLFDYMYLMKACYAAGSPYIALFEDDILAMDGWFHRTVKGLELAEKKTAEDRDPGDFLYMRVFHTEEFLGWNSEDIPTHIFWSSVIIALVASLLYGLRSTSQHAQRYFTGRTMLAICFVYVPLLIVLFFAAGKVTTLPLAIGVNKMNNYGCCAQGLVFPHHKAGELIHWYEAAPRIGLRDSLIEKYADERNELRWALTPSVIQHIGTKSSKGGRGPKSKAEVPMTQKLWSFPFELNDADALRQEHKIAVAIS